MSSRLVCGSPQRILIVRLSAIGDTILTSPLLAAIRDHLPEAEVDWVVEPKSRPVVEMCEGVSRIWTFPRIIFPHQAIASPRRGAQLFHDLSALHRQMLERGYDAALDVQGLFKSGVAAAVSGARWRVGWRPADCREGNFFFTNHWMTMGRGCHAVDSWLPLLDSIGCRPERVRFPLRPPQDALDQMRAFLHGVSADGRPVVLLNVGSSDQRKCWPAERFAELARLACRDFQAVLVFTWGSEAEHKLAEETARTAGEGAVVSVRTTIQSLAALEILADAFVGADTGPLHLAAAMGTPVVGIYSLTNPRRLAPYGEGHRTVYRPDGIDGIQTSDVYSQLAEVLQAGKARQCRRR